MSVHIKTKESLKELEDKLRAHPMVAARLHHKRDTFAAEAAVRHYVYGEPFPVSTWPSSSTAQQVKMAYDEVSKKE